MIGTLESGRQGLSLTFLGDVVQVNIFRGRGLGY